MGSKEAEMCYCVRETDENVRGLSKAGAALPSGTVTETLYKGGKVPLQRDYRSLNQNSH